jgi:hypothetical protein
VPADVADGLTVFDAFDQQEAPLERDETATVGQILGQRPRRQPEIVELADRLRSAGSLVEE